MRNIPIWDLWGFLSNKTVSSIPVYSDDEIGVINPKDEKESVRNDAEDLSRSDGEYGQGKLRDTMNKYTSVMQGSVGDDSELPMKESMSLYNQYDESLQLQHDIGIAQSPCDSQIQLHDGKPNMYSHAKLLRIRRFSFVFLILFAVIPIAYLLRVTSLVDKPRPPYGGIPPNPAKPGNETKPTQDKPDPAQDPSDSMPGPSNILPETLPSGVVAEPNKNDNPFGIDGLEDQVINLLGMEISGPEDAKSAVKKLLDNVVLLMRKRSDMEQGIKWSYDVSFNQVETYYKNLTDNFQQVYSEISELLKVLPRDKLVGTSAIGQIRIGNFEFEFFALSYIKDSLGVLISDFGRISTLISSCKEKFVREREFNDSTTFKDVFSNPRLVEGEDINEIIRFEVGGFWMNKNYVSDLFSSRWPDGLAMAVLHYNGQVPFRLMDADPSEYSQNRRETWQLAVEIASDWRLKRAQCGPFYKMAIGDIFVSPSLSWGRGKGATGAEAFTLWVLKKLKKNLSERIGHDGRPLIIDDKEKALEWIDLEMIRLREGLEYIEDSEKDHGSEDKPCFIRLSHLKNALLFQMNKYEFMKQNISSLDMQSGECVLKAAFCASGYKKDVEAIKHHLTGRKTHLFSLLLDIADP